MIIDFRGDADYQIFIVLYLNVVVYENSDVNSKQSTVEIYELSMSLCEGTHSHSIRYYINVKEFDVSYTF